MPSNNSKYTEEMREQTAQYIIESGKSATGVAKHEKLLSILGISDGFEKTFIFSGIIVFLWIMFHV